MDSNTTILELSLATDRKDVFSCRIFTDNNSEGFCSCPDRKLEIGQGLIRGYESS